jgi:hypothetical protein
MDSHFLTPETLATRWNMASKTLSQWRWNGRGPQYHKLGKLVRYQIADVEAFERTKMKQTTPTNEYPPFSLEANLLLKGFRYDK